jgi:hypothetical protein
VIGALSGDLVCSLDVEPTFTVRRLKTEISKVKGIPVEMQSIMLCNRQLQDNEKLSSIESATSGNPEVSLIVQSVGLAKQVVYRTDESGTSIQWKIDKKRLPRNDRQLVSPSFNLNFGELLQNKPFRIVLQAGQLRTFKQSQGKGEVLLKCEHRLPDDEYANVQFAVAIGDGESFAVPHRRIAHNFAESCLCRMPQGHQLFDFKAANGLNSTSFTICIQLTHKTR